MRRSDDRSVLDIPGLMAELNLKRTTAYALAGRIGVRVSAALSIVIPEGEARRVFAYRSSRFPAALDARESAVSADDAIEAALARALARDREQLVGEIAAAVVLLVVQELAPRLPARIFDIRDTARVLGKVSTATVKRMIADGELKTLKVRGRTMCDLTTVRGLDAAEVAELAAEICERKPTPRKAKVEDAAAAPVDSAS